MLVQHFTDSPCVLGSRLFLAVCAQSTQWSSDVGRAAIEWWSKGRHSALLAFSLYGESATPAHPLFLPAYPF